MAAGGAGDDFNAAFGGSGSEDPRTQQRAYGCYSSGIASASSASAFCNDASA